MASRVFNTVDAAEVWDWLARKYNAKVVAKASSWEMKTAAMFLGLANIAHPVDFMSRYATTLGSTIYLPYRPGICPAGSTWSAWKQILNAAHEFMHVLQWRGGKIEYLWDYTTSTQRRAMIECECYATAYEVCAWAKVAAPSPYSIAAKLADYACKPENVVEAEARLTEIRDQVARFDLSDPAQWKYMRTPSQDVIGVLSGKIKV